LSPSNLLLGRSRTMLNDPAAIAGNITSTYSGCTAQTLKSPDTFETQLCNEYRTLEHHTRDKTLSLSVTDAGCNCNYWWSQVNMHERYLTHKGTANRLGKVIPLNETAMDVLREIQGSSVRHMTRVFTWMKPKKVKDVLRYTVGPLNNYGRAWQKGVRTCRSGTLRSEWSVAR
jgi:hypothetical protein